jgi:hypothetical protein
MRNVAPPSYDEAVAILRANDLPATAMDGLAEVERLQPDPSNSLKLLVVQLLAEKKIAAGAEVGFSWPSASC